MTGFHFFLRNPNRDKYLHCFAKWFAGTASIAFPNKWIGRRGLWPARFSDLRKPFHVRSG